MKNAETGGLTLAAAPAPWGARLGRVSFALAGSGALLAGVALLGWVLGIESLKSGLPGQATMKVNTAICFLLLSGAVLASRAPGTRRQFSTVLAGVSACIAALTATQYLTGADLGIDQLFTRDESAGPYPGRMAPNTALAFLSLSAGIALRDRGITAEWAMQVAGFIAFAIGMVAAIGYVFGVRALHGVPGFTSMALPSALGLATLSLSMLLSRPERGALAVLAANGPSGAVARALLPTLVVVPIAIGSLRLAGQRAGLYETEFGLAVMVTTTVGLLGGLALWNLNRLGQLEREEELDRKDEHFLFELGELLRFTFDLNALFRQVATSVAGHLNAERCALVEIDVKEARVQIYPDFSAQGRSLEGMMPIGETGLITRAALERGELHVVDDARTSAATRDQYATRYGPLGFESFVVAPAIRGRAGLAALVVASGAPRSWTPREIRLVERAAERAWLWVNQVRVMATLRDNERKMTLLNQELESRVEARTAELQQTLGEREVLLKEVHHRVKNNLQIIISLMNMQMRQLEHGQGRRALEECSARIGAIALVHEKLYESPNYARVEFGEYLKHLVADVVAAAGQARIRVEVEADDLVLPVDQAIPCGLMVNEALTNTFKHAFPGERTGSVKVTFRKSSDSEVALMISDDGVGFSGTPRSGSLGSGLIETLARQVGGQLSVESANGVTYQLHFSKGKTG